MSNKITGKEYPLLKVFSSDFEYYIPAYQRPYAWTTDQTGELFQDLYDFYIAEASDNFFLGTIVLIKADDKPHADVIDGQQRLTTLTILFSVLAYNLTGDAKQSCINLLRESGNILAGIPARSRMHLRERDQTFFDKFIQSVQLDELVKLDSTEMASEAQKHIRENAMLLMKRFEDTFKQNQEELIKFSSFLLNRCFLVSVSTDNQESAFRVFSVMNSRGLDLLPIDIIKSEVIGAISEEQRQKYTDKWEEIENITGRDGFNEVFTHTRMIFAKEKAKKGLLDEFKEHVAKRFTPDSLVDDILVPYADAYTILKNKEYTAAFGADKVNDILYWLNKIDNSDWMPSAIRFLAEHPHNTEYITYFLSKLERLTAYLHVTAQGVNQRIERYKWVLAEMESRPEHSLEEPLTSLELTKNEKKLFLEALDGDIYNMTSRRRNYVIQRLDAFSSDGAAKYDVKIFTIEHVLPQHPLKDSEWDKEWPDTEERKYWLNRIANLVPLTRKHNSAAQNFEFQKKKDVYFKNANGTTSYCLTTQVTNISSWTPDIVKARQSQLLEIFKEKWHLSDSEDSTESDNTNTVFHLVNKECNATGYLAENGKFVIAAGSNVSSTIKSSCGENICNLRKKLVDNGIIVDNVFIEDYPFSSPSAAAVMVCGRSANGLKEWTTLDGIPYGKINGR